jgi:2-dehydro-3-deoxygluconokinase
MTDGTILALGEALVEFMPPHTDTSMRGAQNWQRYAGGGPATYAAAVMRCGGKSSLLTRVGVDPLSDFMIGSLLAEGVDVTAIQHIEGRQIGLCFHECIKGQSRLIFHRHDSAATTMTPEDIDLQKLSTAAALHVPGTTLQISPSASDTCMAAISAARTAGVPVSFDPNIRSIHRPGQPLDEALTTTLGAFEEALATADVVTPTLEEALAITGKGDATSAARELRSMGPGFVVITLAAEGCLILTQADVHPVYCPGYEVDVVEPTGAGDCHAAATMVGFLSGWDPARIGAFANAAGAIAVTAMGHFGQALPTLERMQGLIDAGASSAPPRQPLGL